MGRVTHGPERLMFGRSKPVKIVVGIMIIVAAYYVIARIALRVIFHHK
jgi:hypothetical protein